MSVAKVILPKLGLTMDEGRLIAWQKKEGDRVEKGEVLFEIETDKANMEIGATASGILRRILVPAGATVPVTTVIALIADTADEALPSDLAHSLPPASSTTFPSSSSAGVRRSLDEAPASRATSPQDGERVRSSPAARKRAQELRVDINAVRGTGPGGRISIEDVEVAARPAATTVGEKREPLTRMRRAVAEAMMRSVHQSPQFSISRDVDMTAANGKRMTAGVSYTDMIVAAAAVALRGHPRLRSRYDGDALVTADRIDVGSQSPSMSV